MATRVSAVDRRASLVGAGWDLLRDGGPSAVTIDGVVDRLGVSRPIFYRHFADRTALVAAMYDDYAADLAARTQPLLLAELPPEEFLLRLFGAYLDCVADRGTSVRALVDYFAHVPEVEAARQRLRDQQTLVAEQGLSARLPKSKRVQLRRVVRLLNAVSVEAATWLLAGEISRRDAEALAERFLTSGLAAVLA